MKRHLLLTAAGQTLPALGLAATSGHWVVGPAVAVAGLAIFVPVTNAYLRGERRGWLGALLDVPYFIHWTAGLLAIPLALVLVGLAALLRPSALGLALLSSYGVGLALAAYGALVRRRLVRTERIELPIARLPRAFDRYRIAHLSDLHIGPWTSRSRALRWAARANALAPDLVVVTGDLVSNGSTFHEDIADVVGALRARDGVVVALGNHDYFGDAERLVSMLRARGARVLRNGSERIRRDDQPLLVAAIDDRWSRRADLAAALEDHEPPEPVVLLAHDPIDFEAAAARGVDLVLSGHTHGGQLAVPLLARHANLSRFTREHTLGVYRRGESALVVHPGLGTSGPPVRLGVAPAVLEITLRAGTTDF